MIVCLLVMSGLEGRQGHLAVLHVQRLLLKSGAGIFDVRVWFLLSFQQPTFQQIPNGSRHPNASTRAAPRSTDLTIIIMKLLSSTITIIIIHIIIIIITTLLLIIINSIIIMNTIIRPGGPQPQPAALALVHDLHGAGRLHHLA